jgi:predicted nucleic acid-binding protein
MILVDTSAWVEFDRATDSPADRRLTKLIADGRPIAVTEPIVMEVTAGARDDVRERDLRRLLARFQLLRFDSVVDFDAAARIYRRCRREGVTPRGMIDCMIASVALRSDAVLLACDADLERVANVVGIRLDT